MDINSLLSPQVYDSEMLQEFLDSLSDQVPGIERDVANLKQKPGNKVLISTLFRALHTIKGDAALCKVDMGVMITHPIESLLGRLRSGEISFSDVLAEVILLAMDRLELATKSLTEGRPTTQLKLVELVDGLNGMADASVETLDGKAALLIEAVTGFRPIASAAKTITRGSGTPRATVPASDLRFFHTLALQYEARSPLYKGRSERQLRLALATNTRAGKPIDPLQLEAAVYMHDVGMLFLPETVWLRAEKLSDMDRRTLQQHPVLGAGLLERMEGWKPAAAMVLMHHERQDGAGYPSHLQGDQIVPGAKLLAIIDTFESVTLKHNQRGTGRSLLRAIAEVNACDDQFDLEWITHFNAVIRHMVEG